MRWEAVLGLAFFLSGARAQSSDGVKRAYVGASATALTGAGVERHHFDAAGGDVFAGYRLSRWVSIEGFFATHLGWPSSDSGGSDMCSGTSAETWHWESFGARLWIHLLHLDRVDVSIAPTSAFGVSARHVRSLLSPNQLCYSPPASGNFGWALDGGVAVGVEARPTPWLGLRAVVEPAIDLGVEDPYYGYLVLSVSGWVGALVRF